MKLWNFDSEHTSNAQLAERSNLFRQACLLLLCVKNIVCIYKKIKLEINGNRIPCYISYFQLYLFLYTLKSSLEIMAGATSSTSK